MTQHFVINPITHKGEWVEIDAFDGPYNPREDIKRLMQSSKTVGEYR